MEYCKSQPNLPPPLLRLFLLFDGTVTHFFETVFLETISFELEGQSEMILSNEDAIRLSVPKGEKGMQRQGWLTRKNSPNRMLYVDSIFPRLSPPLYQEILLGQKTLGQIIHSQKLLLRRDRIEIGLFSLPKIASGFGSLSDPMIWARRYRLILAGEGSLLLFEAISPHITNLMIDNTNENDFYFRKTK